ncbi:hypothetical protein ACC862_24305 [Rhizobium ruizarguesonis]
MKLIVVAALGAALSAPAFAEEGGFSDKSKSLLQEAITRQGFNCPTIRTITSKGADAHGDVLQVACRVEGAGMTNRVYYRVTLTADDILVEPAD